MTQNITTSTVARGRSARSRSIVDKVGMEWEIGVSRADYGSDLKYWSWESDGSISARSVDNRAVELVSSPMSPLTVPKALAEAGAIAAEANDSMGFHVHLSVKSPAHYSLLSTEIFLRYFAGKLTEFAVDDARLRERFASRWCAVRPDAVDIDRQLAVQSKDGCRYAFLNFCRSIHGTIECRVFPSRRDVRRLGEYVRFVVDTIDGYYAAGHYFERDGVKHEEPDEVLNLDVPPLKKTGDSTQRTGRLPVFSERQSDFNVRVENVDGNAREDGSSDESEDSGQCDCADCIARRSAQDEDSDESEGSSQRDEQQRADDSQRARWLSMAMDAHRASLNTEPGRENVHCSSGTGRHMFTVGYSHAEDAREWTGQYNGSCNCAACRSVRAFGLASDRYIVGFHVDSTPRTVAGCDVDAWISDGEYVPGCICAACVMVRRTVEGGRIAEGSYSSRYDVNGRVTR